MALLPHPPPGMVMPIHTPSGPSPAPGLRGGDTLVSTESEIFVGGKQMILINFQLGVSDNNIGTVTTAKQLKGTENNNKMK